MAHPQPIISTDYPYLPIRVQIGDWQDEASALLDTGFTAELVIPERILDQDIGFPDQHISVEVGDGRVVNAPVYLGALEIVGLSPMPGVVIVVLDHEFILGRRIFDLFWVAFDHGERVIVEL